MAKIRQFVKKEAVLTVSLVLTLLSFIAAPPSKDTLTYIDFSVLSVLFCLMAVVAGFRKANVFDVMSESMLKRTGSTKSLEICLVGLCFFSSMVVTNDVALITFVPFTLSILRRGGKKNMAFTVVMETIAANLGSMMTPVGNPQNLFLFRYYSMRLDEFFSYILPLGLVSFLLISAVMLLQKPGKQLAFTYCEDNTPNKSTLDRSGLLKFSLMFMLCILTVLHVLDYRITLSVICLVLLINDRDIFSRVDYMLLLTFVCFFLFVGNIGSIPVIRNFITGALTGKELLVSVVLSQGISNVPAAVMLAPFTNNAADLLRGVNIGGLGTLIASFASLISYKFYSSDEGASKSHYMIVFSAANFGMLVILLAVSSLI